MNATMRWTTPILLAALLLPGCDADSTERGAPDSSRQEATRATEGGEAVQAPSAARVALPGLFSIMAGLEGDMAQISRGLWLENFDTVAAGADAIANHPRIPPEEFGRISGVLGEEMPSFGGMDMRVHDLAVRLAEEARREELDAVLSTDADLRRACVSCHSTFRERLREQIR